MVLLHLVHHATATSTNRVRIELPHEIKSQVITLKKSIVVHRCDPSHPEGFCENVVYVDLPFVSMYENSNNNAHSWLPLSVDPEKYRTESDYHIRFKAGDIPIRFDVLFYKKPDGTPYNFQTDVNDSLQEVHLWFEYESNVSVV
jgi:hypothetical protein